MKTFKYKSGDVYLNVERYAIDGSPCLQLLNAVDDPDNDQFEGELVTTATVYLEDQKLPTDCVFIKTWNENEGIISVLVREGYLEPSILGKVPTGFVSASICRMTPKCLKLVKKTEKHS